MLISFKVTIDPAGISGVIDSPTQSVAKSQLLSKGTSIYCSVLELAKQNLAGQIQTEVTALVDNQVSNKQLSDEQAASVTQSVSASKNLISQSIGRVIPVMELYRTKTNKNKEVLVRIAYNAEMAKEAAKKAIRQELEQRGDELAKKLDGLLNW